MELKLEPPELDWSKLLLSRLSWDKTPTLESYLEEGGFLGLMKAQQYTPLEVVVQLRDSGLRGRGRDAGPVFLKWWRFIRSGGEQAELLVDAAELDPRSLNGRALLQKNPFGLLEGLCIASLVSGARRARVCLAPHLAELGPKLLAGMEEINQRGLLQGRVLEFQCCGRAEVPAASGPRLSHSLETWYHVTLVISLGASWYTAHGLNGQSGTRLLSVGGEVARPGLVELPMGAHLWQALDLAGGLSDLGSFKFLCLDQGVSGFLPLEQAAVPLAPEELMSAGVNPGLGTVQALPHQSSLVPHTARALAAILEQDLEPEAETRRLTARAAELVRACGQGQAGAGELAELQGISRRLERGEALAAWPLASALRYFPEDWPS